MRAARSQVFFNHSERNLGNLVLVLNGLRRQRLFFRWLGRLAGCNGRGLGHQENMLAILAANLLAANGIRPLARVATIRAGYVDRSHVCEFSPRKQQPVYSIIADAGLGNKTGFPTSYG